MGSRRARQNHAACKNNPSLFGWGVTLMAHNAGEERTAAEPCRAGLLAELGNGDGDLKALPSPLFWEKQQPLRHLPHPGPAAPSPPYPLLKLTFTSPVSSPALVIRKRALLYVYKYIDFHLELLKES